MKNFKNNNCSFMLSGSLLITSCRSSDNAVDNSGENLITNGFCSYKDELVLGSEYETETISTQASVKNTGVSSVVKRTGKYIYGR